MSKTWDEMEPRERDAWIAENVMGFVREHALFCEPTAFYYRVPDQFTRDWPNSLASNRHVVVGATVNYAGTFAPSRDAFADYEVLCRVRETWTLSRLNDFCEELWELMEFRVGHKPFGAVPLARYEPGDYSQAAYLALTQTDGG